MIHGKRLTL